MPLAHSVFKQTVVNINANQLQQHTIEICCKMIQLIYQLTCEANHFVSSTKCFFLSQYYVGQLLHVYLIVF